MEWIQSKIFNTNLLSVNNCLSTKGSGEQCWSYTEVRGSSIVC